VGQRGMFVEEVVHADAETAEDRRHRVVQRDVVVHGPTHGYIGAGGLINVEGGETADETRLPLRAQVVLVPVERRRAAPPRDVAELGTVRAGILDDRGAGLT